MEFQRSWEDIPRVRFVHYDIGKCYLKLDYAECPQSLRHAACKSDRNEMSVFACQFKESLKFSSSLSCVINKGLIPNWFNGFIYRPIRKQRSYIKESNWMDSLSWRVSSNAMR